MFSFIICFAVLSLNILHYSDSFVYRPSLKIQSATSLKFPTDFPHENSLRKDVANQNGPIQSKISLQSSVAGAVPEEPITARRKLRKTGTF